MAKDQENNKKRRRTAIVQAGVGTDAAYKAVMPPLYLSSTFKIDNLDRRGKYEYSRTRNPTRDLLAEVLAELEEGCGACITSSGMAALTLILHLLGPDDLLLAPHDCYGRSHRLMQALSEKGHFRLAYVNQCEEKELDAAIARGPRMVLIETPSNPVMRVADIAAVSRKAKEKGAIVVCDNTFLSPMLQQPLNLGADIVFHSTTKFLNGHSDVVGGGVVAKTKELWEQLDFWANSLGLIGAPFDSYMTLRGLRTLELRIHRAQDNAKIIAEALANHKAVRAVHYPGLSSHPGHRLAKKQQEGFGSMLSFELAGGRGAVKAFLGALEIFCLAQSLGGTESLVCHPASMTHASMDPQAREQAGVSERLLRLSVGIEHVDDLLRDLEKALERALQSGGP